MNPFLAAALEYARLGWRVIPLHNPRNGACSCKDPECKHVGKHPRIKGWKEKASTDPATIMEWWSLWPSSNVGIATGAALLVVDRDGDELPGNLPEGPRVKTSKGEHYYLAQPEGVTINAVNVKGLGFDIRTSGGLVVAPPSVHPSGHVYHWASPYDAPLPQAPPWLLELIADDDRDLPAFTPDPSMPEPSQRPTQGGGATAYAQKALDGELARVRRAPAGQRNDQLNRSAFALGTLVGGGELDQEAVADALLDSALVAGLGQSEAAETIRSGLAAGMLKPRTIEPPTLPEAQRINGKAKPEAIRWQPQDFVTERPPWVEPDLVLSCLHEEEYGDAKLLTEIYQGRLVFDHAEKTWYYWQGHSWVADRTGMIRHLIAGQVARQYLHLAAELKPRAQTEERTDKLVEKLISRAANLRKLSRCNNVREFATSLLGIAGDEWDRDPWVLGVANGVLDLRTGKLRDGQPGDYIRVTSDTIWRGLEEPAPRFEQFIKEIFDGDAEIAGFLQRLLGYGVTGLAVEHVFPVLWGEKGRNGKDTLLETLKVVLGDLADVVSTDVLMAQTGRGSAAPHLMDLMGRRLVWASETAAGGRLNEAQVKLITGGGTIKTRPLYGSMVEFAPTHLVLLITNHKPKASAEDEALWNRMVLLPFTMRFVANPAAPDERQRDPHLVARMSKERSGILAWLVRGCMTWQKDGLAIPDKIRARTQEYRDEEDLIGQFITESCVLAPDTRVKAADLYHAYRKWAEEGGMQPLSQINFGKRIVKRFTKTRTNAFFVYLGVAIRSESDPCDPCDPFSQESLHESDRGKNFRANGSNGSHGSRQQPEPPPGQGSGAGAGAVGQSAAGTAPEARHSVDTRRWYQSRARELLRSVGTPAELGTNLDAFTTPKLIEFVEFLEARLPSGAERSD